MASTNPSQRNAEPGARVGVKRKVARGSTRRTAPAQTASRGATGSKAFGEGAVRQTRGQALTTHGGQTGGTPEAGRNAADARQGRVHGQPRSGMHAGINIEDI
jgi:hypothetical protein